MRAPAAEGPAALDLGPAEARRNGHAVVAVVADPAAPHRDIRRAHTRHHVLTLLRRGGLELREAVACLRWSELCEMAAGGRDLPGILAVSVRVEPWMRGHPGEVQLRAVRLLENARIVLGRALSDVVHAYAVEGLEAKALGARMGLDDRVVMGLVRAGLLRLSEHWKL